MWRFYGSEISRDSTACRKSAFNLQNILQVIWVIFYALKKIDRLICFQNGLFLDRWIRNSTNSSIWNMLIILLKKITCSVYCDNGGSCNQSEKKDRISVQEKPPRESSDKLAYTMSSFGHGRVRAINTMLRPSGRYKPRGLASGLSTVHADKLCYTGFIP